MVTLFALPGVIIMEQEHMKNIQGEYMKNHIPIAGIMLILASLLFSGCIMNKVSTEKEIILLKGETTGREIQLEIETGESWSRRMQAGPFIFNLLSQIVLWTEDDNGKLLETLYVSGADYRKMRHAEKKDKGEAFFRGSFPLWAQKMKEAGKQLPSPDNPFPDTITSATPTSDFTLETKLELSQPPFTLFAEVNSSGDENETFTREKNGWIGQPALLYAVEIERDLKNREKEGAYTLKLIGHSGLPGQEAAIHTDLSGFDSALRQVKRIDLLIPSP